MRRSFILRNRLNDTINGNFEKAFMDIFRDDLIRDVGIHSDTNFPRTDIIDSDEKVILELAVPGYSKSDIKTTIKDNILRVSGKSSSGHENEKYVTRQIKRSSFSKDIYLNEDVLDFDSIKANHQDGILQITIRKYGDNEQPNGYKEIKIK